MSVCTADTIAESFANDSVVEELGVNFSHIKMKVRFVGEPSLGIDMLIQRADFGGLESIWEN